MRGVVPAGRPLTVLELGSGEGAMLGRLVRDGHRVTGVDPRARAVPGAAVHVGDFAAVADEEGWEERFDLVIAIHCLEHVDDLPQVLARVHRALRPGGTFYALTPNASSEGLRLLGSAWWMLEDPTHRQFVSPTSARLLLERSGMVDVRTRPVRLDSLSVEGASLARMRGTVHPEGVLSSRTARIASVAVLPLTVPARFVRPRLAPTLEIVSSRPTGSPA
jgi:SAM-dependent methyltransferase